MTHQQVFMWLYPLLKDYSIQIQAAGKTYYLETQNAGIPILHRFLSAAVNSRLGPTMPFSDLYGHYAHYHRTGNYKYLVTAQNFATEVKRVRGIERAGVECTIRHDVLREALLAIRHYDTDAFL